MTDLKKLEYWKQNWIPFSCFAVIAFCVGITIKAWVSDPPKQLTEFDYEELGHDISRLETKEAVCYLLNKTSINCFWKERKPYEQSSNEDDSGCVLF